MRNEAEHHAQAAVISWARMAQGTDPRLRLLHAIPNGGHRDVRVAGKLKREGVLAGIPDLCLPVPSREYHGLYVEMKVGSNTPSKDQQQILTLLKAQGFAAVIARGAEEGIAALAYYLHLPNPCPDKIPLF